MGALQRSAARIKATPAEVAVVGGVRLQRAVQAETKGPCSVRLVARHALFAAARLEQVNERDVHCVAAVTRPVLAGRSGVAQPLDARQLAPRAELRRGERLDHREVGERACRGERGPKHEHGAACKGRAQPPEQFSSRAGCLRRTRELLWTRRSIPMAAGCYSAIAKTTGLRIRA